MICRPKTRHARAARISRTRSPSANSPTSRRARRHALRPAGRGRAGCAAALAGLVLLLAGCGSTPPRPASEAGVRPGAAVRPATPARRDEPVRQPAPDSTRDGPDANPPPNLVEVPDAEPRIEPLRVGGPNKPYEVLGTRYEPATTDVALAERGLASWYGRKFHGRPTANGETYDMYAMTAAHKTMPLPSYARVRNPRNGHEVVVRINDRGPFHAERVIDLSYTAALKLGLLGGVAPVEVQRITHEAIRTGSWRNPRLPPVPGLVLDDTAVATLAREPSEAPAGARPAAGGAYADDPIAAFASRPGRHNPAAMPSLPPPPAPGQPLAGSHSEPGAATHAARGWWLQLGAFRDHDGAVGFRQRVAQAVDGLGPLLAIFRERDLHRLQAGPYASRHDAALAADRLRATLALVPAIVERR
ncbi:septal ring lytic transglycosylase RlpA family protein [Aquabacterium sp. OR-4]|uniref:septal ring lytic transglycosylase RlpA family protein n=1 Tax=Aquabacterium sp. OR-4 TaxID=2978127 RepID=UPI0028C5F54A|nr:septal ring lytic transglycosylase RlpA family protein [Aquabacterium sp. OR-4]MDT7833634.1 septal ring lytic transglycosylase RlpA family protein [Aquabacterium sp. OR-4]